MSWRRNKRVAAGAEAGVGRGGWDLRSSTRWNCTGRKTRHRAFETGGFWILFQMDGNSVGPFLAGEYNPEKVFTKMSMAALYKRLWRWNIETGRVGGRVAN